MYEHIVFISIDTLRSDCIGVNPLKLWPQKYGNARAPNTAVLDALVARGAFFANCVSAAPYTSASHASIFTGKWPQRHGVFEFFNRKLAGPTVFTTMHRAGYRTIMKSDFPLILGPTLGFDRGIDTFLVEDDDAYLDAIAAQPKTVSLVHFGGVHVPYGYHNLRYGGDAYRAKLDALEHAYQPPASVPKDQLFETPRDQQDMDLLLRYKNVIEHLWRTDRADAIFDLYLDGIEWFLQHRFAGFMAKLEQILHGKRALIVLFGDHGEEYDADSYGHFNSVAEGVLRVPLLFLGDGVKPGIHTGRVCTVDVLPTVLDLQGGRRARPQDLDGISLAATVRAGEPYAARMGFAQAYVADTMRFVRFQQKMMRVGKKQGALPHLLFKETVWDGEYKLSRVMAEFEQYLGGMAAVEPRYRLEHFDADQVPHRIDDAAMQARLGRRLDQYNAVGR